MPKESRVVAVDKTVNSVIHLTMTACLHRPAGTRMTEKNSTKRGLYSAINNCKVHCRAQLLDEVDGDPWGFRCRVVIRKIRLFTYHQTDGQYRTRQLYVNSVRGDEGCRLFTTKVLKAVIFCMRNRYLYLFQHRQDLLHAHATVVRWNENGKATSQQ